MTKRYHSNNNHGVCSCQRCKEGKGPCYVPGATCCMCGGSATRLGGPWHCKQCKRFVCSHFCIERHAIVVDHHVSVELVTDGVGP